MFWRVWSRAPGGLHVRCRRTFPHADWQWAEKYAQALRERGHEDVHVERAAREE